MGKLGGTATILLLTLLWTSCVSHVLRDKPPEPPQPQVEMDQVMRLVGRFNIGHACPCDGVVLSAAHVVAPLFLRNGFQALQLGFAWSDMRGNAGYVLALRVTTLRDVGAFFVLAGTPAFYRHAMIPPLPGDDVYWLEYDGILGLAERRGKVVRLTSGHIIFAPSAVQGASGTCLFNAKGEVIGIVSWRAAAGTKVEGVAVAVYGPWWPSELEN